MKEGRWDRKLYSGSELYGKTLAVLGLGRIGREVASRMKAWGMRVSSHLLINDVLISIVILCLNGYQVIGYDPITTAEEAKAVGIEKMELNDIWILADYITVHTPLIPATKSN